MAYSNTTRFYKIPYMGEGDILTEEQERIQMGAIDNLLYVATFGSTDAFLEEGAYSLVWNQANTECHLEISPLSEGSRSLLGILNGLLFMSTATVSSETLYPDTEYSVYIEYSEGMETDSQNFSIVAYTETPDDDNPRMLLCEIDTTGVGTVNTNVNKTYVPSVTAHANATANPHGRTLTQENLAVVSSVTIGGKPVNAVEYTSAVTAGNGSAVTVNFTSSTPLFVTVYPQATGAGEIAWTISGSSVSIVNTGSAGITLNIRADVQ